MIAANQQEYRERYAALNFPAKTELDRAEAKRRQILAELDNQVEIGCHGTKLDLRSLAPGCRHCVTGGWSCLFINGRCNCDCFYCPSEQSEIGLPTTNTVSFRHPADYVAYLERFGFSGASISGGEPLLTPNRSIGFLSAINRRFGSSIHTWLYTNGTLLTRDLAQRLGDAGLNEIRVDIGATDYNLKNLREVAGIIPTLTVEIPAIPEDSDHLKRLLSDLVDSGVNHLNLHQLRLTHHNYPRLFPRDYRYLHGEKVTVLDSELTALEVIRFGLEQKIPLPINYCSFVYKHRYQAMAARRRNAVAVSKSYESLTENGYIRTLTLLGEPFHLNQLRNHFSSSGQPQHLWNSSRSGEQLVIHPLLWPLVDPVNLKLRIDYSAAHQHAAVSYRNPFTLIELSPRQKIVVERSRESAGFELDGHQAEWFGRVFLGGNTGIDSLPENDLWGEIIRFERITAGLQDYF